MARQRPGVQRQRTGILDMFEDNGDCQVLEIDVVQGVDQLVPADFPLVDGIDGLRFHAARGRCNLFFFLTADFSTGIAISHILGGPIHILAHNSSSDHSARHC